MVASTRHNLVEGRRQASDKEFARFLRYALNSGYELEYHLMIAHDLAVLSEDDFSGLMSEAIEVRKMLHGLLNRIKAGASNR